MTLQVCIAFTRIKKHLFYFPIRMYFFCFSDTFVFQEVNFSKEKIWKAGKKLYNSNSWKKKILSQKITCFWMQSEVIWRPNVLYWWMRFFSWKHILSCFFGGGGWNRWMAFAFIPMEYGITWIVEMLWVTKGIHLVSLGGPSSIHESKQPIRSHLHGAEDPITATVLKKNHFPNPRCFSLLSKGQWKHCNFRLKLSKFYFCTIWHMAAKCHLLKLAINWRRNIWLLLRRLQLPVLFVN